MAWDCPQGFDQYRDLLFRFSEVRGAGGGKWCQFRCLFPDRHRNGDRNWSGLAWIGERGELVARCLGCGANWKEFVRETGTTPRDWFPQKPGDERRRRVQPKLAAVFRYCDADGTFRYEKRRWEADGRKWFDFRRPLPEDLRVAGQIPAGVESWVYGVMADEYGRPDGQGHADFHRFDQSKHGVRLVIDAADPLLYRLPELLAANPEHPVLVVEGEADADLLRGLGFVATCGCHGSSTWLPEWSEHLRGRRVCVVPDHNAVGYRHAEQVAGAVLRAGAAGVRVAEWGDEDGGFYPGVGGGVGNWLSGRERKQWRGMVVELCRGIPEYRAAA